MVIFLSKNGQCIHFSLMGSSFDYNSTNEFLSVGNWYVVFFFSFGCLRLRFTIHLYPLPLLRFLALFTMWYYGSMTFSICSPFFFLSILSSNEVCRNWYLLLLIECTESVLRYFNRKNICDMPYRMNGYFFWQWEKTINFVVRANYNMKRMVIRSIFWLLPWST